MIKQKIIIFRKTSATQILSRSTQCCTASIYCTNTVAHTKHMIRYGIDFGVISITHSTITINFIIFGELSNNSFCLHILMFFPHARD